MIAFTMEQMDSAGGETKRFHTALVACMGATTDLKAPPPRDALGPSALRPSAFTLLVWSSSVWLDGLVPFCQNPTITSYPAPPPQLSFPYSSYQTTLAPHDHRLSFLNSTPCFTRHFPDLDHLCTTTTSLTKSSPSFQPLI